jgi:hypothetical protein
MLASFVKIGMPSFFDPANRMASLTDNANLFPPAPNPAL